MSEPQASIVITNFNYEHFVGPAVESALAQTVSCQVIVVDDGSTDDSRSTLGDYGHRYGDRFQLISKPNGGQASAVNAGWAEVETPLVFFLDGDDLLDPNAVEHVITSLQTMPDAVRCQFRLRWIDGKGRTIPGGFPEPGRSLPAGDLRQRMTSNPDDIAWQPTSGNAFRSTLLERLLPMPEEPYRISADHYLSNLSALYGPIAAVESELGSYRVHGENADHRERFDVGRARDILTRTEVTHRLLLEHGPAAGLAMPESAARYLSLSGSGLRLSSYRLDGPAGRGSANDPSPGHPFPEDRLPNLVGRGLAAARARRDLSPIRRLAAMAWIGLLAVAPKRYVPAIAASALTR